MSDKQTEELVASNRDLLESQNFANMISVKQLEYLVNKSEIVSETEKSKLKNLRFADINTAMDTTPGAGRVAAIAAIRSNIRNLSDAELEMINDSHLADDGFVSQMKASQVENINKSTKFSTSTKNSFRKARRKPLADALLRRNTTEIKAALKALGPKEITALDMSILKMPTMLEAYNKSLLKRMAPEMNPSDVVELHDEIIRAARMPGAPANVIDLEHWLGTADGAIFS